MKKIRPAIQKSSHDLNSDKSSNTTRFKSRTFSNWIQWNYLGLTSTQTMKFKYISCLSLHRTHSAIVLVLLWWRRDWMDYHKKYYPIIYIELHEMSPFIQSRFTTKQCIHSWVKRQDVNNIIIMNRVYGHHGIRNSNDVLLSVL